MAVTELSRDSVQWYCSTVPLIANTHLVTAHGHHCCARVQGQAPHKGTANAAGRAKDHEDCVVGAHDRMELWYL